MNNFIVDEDHLSSQDLQHITSSIDYQTTDTANAERLVRDHGRDYLYCEALGGWLHWSGTRWVVDNTSIKEAAKGVGRSLLHEAAEKGDRLERDQLISHAKQTLRERGIHAMVNLATTDPGIGVEAGIFDADPYLLNVENGTIDVKTGTIHDHRREDYITKLAPVMYDPTATAPRWEQFIEQVLPDEDVRKYVQKATAQALTGTTEQQVLYVNYGSGANGKSTFFDTIFSMMGDYAGVIDTDVLMERNRPGGATPEIMYLMGKRMVIASESRQGDHLNESMIKKLTGDEYLTGRNLYAKEMVTFKRLFKLFMHVNHRPEIKGTDHAIWRRPKLIPWTVTIPDEHRDTHLLSKLKGELSGVLNWCLEGYRLYAEEGLEPPQAVRAATDQYRDDMDRVGQFLKDECVLPDEQLIPDDLYVPKDDLYEAYKSWCAKNGVYPEQMRKFGEKMIERGFHPKRTNRIKGKKTPVWRGVALLAD